MKTILILLKQLIVEMTYIKISYNVAYINVIENVVSKKYFFQHNIIQLFLYYFMLNNKFIFIYFIILNNINIYLSIIFFLILFYFKMPSYF